MKKTVFATLSLSVFLSSCVTQSPVLTGETGVYPQTGNRANHPLSGMNEREATAFLEGYFWNGDNDVLRELNLKWDGSFTYSQKQKPKKRDRAIFGVAANMAKEKYPELARNSNWRLEGKWFFESEDTYMIRLDIEESFLDETEEVLPESAFFQMNVIPDVQAVRLDKTGVIMGWANPVADIRLVPIGQGAPIKEALNFGSPSERWEDPIRTSMGHFLIRK